MKADFSEIILHKDKTSNVQVPRNSMFTSRQWRTVVCRIESLRLQSSELIQLENFFDIICIILLFSEYFYNFLC